MQLKYKPARRAGIVEIWKPVPGHEGFYSASNTGKIKSHITLPGGWCRGLLKGGPGKNGYPVVALWKDGASKHHYIHRIVLLTFRGPSRLFGNHIDGNKRNNNIWNLEYVTNEENLRHAHNTGLSHSPLSERGEHNTNAIYSNAMIEQIRQIGYSIPRKELAKMFDINLSYVYGIISGRCRPHG